jgi:hypothetical protein
MMENPLLRGVQLDRPGRPTLLDALQYDLQYIDTIESMQEMMRRIWWTLSVYFGQEAQFSHLVRNLFDAIDQQAARQQTGEGEHAWESWRIMFFYVRRAYEVGCQSRAYGRQRPRPHLYLDQSTRREIGWIASGADAIELLDKLISTLESQVAQYEVKDYLDSFDDNFSKKEFVLWCRSTVSESDLKILQAIEPFIYFMYLAYCLGQSPTDLASHAGNMLNLFGGI